MTTIHFPAGTTHIRYSDMAHHIAKALHDDPWMYGAARVNLDDELAQAVMRGALLLRDPLTLGPHPMPIGAMRDAAIVLLDDLRDFLKGRRISVEVEDSAQASPAPATATQVEPVQAAPAQRAETPVAQAKARRRTWRDVSSAYIVEIMRAGQYATAKELYRALEGKAGPESPFDKGVGPYRGSLFVREIAQPVSIKTIQNNWDALRELAQI